MKKNYFFKFILLAIPFAAFVLMSVSAGRDGAFSSSPGDGGNTCVTCHSGTASASNVTITTDIPVTGYEFNTEYNVTVTSTGGGSRNGFQVTAEKDSDNTKVGAFGSGGSDTQTANSNTRATHTNSGNGQSSWVVKWTSPASDLGKVTFYASVLAGNNDGSTAGDQTFTGQSASTPSLGIDEAKRLDFSMYPNPSSEEMVTIQLPTGILKADVKLYDISGRLISTNEVSSANNQVSVNGLSKGVYIFKVAADGKLGAQQFVKQ